ncbi:agmatinase [Pseudahrensia aquimaris]|uniref:Agmatinase n=1 Tax=Pseudahrensia aquimaris TaxID=744461 RepID=A0ABW3FB39_9HYPH
MDNAFTAKSLNQQAKDSTYAGALSFMRRRYTKDVSEADAVVWGIPFDAAVSNRPGTRFGPRAVREASCGMDNDPQYPFNSRLFDDMAVVDYGDCAFDYGYNEKVPALIEEQASAILNADNAPYLLSIGGDHFVTYPLLKAHAAKHGPLALVQFDAHQDTWDDDGGRVDHGTMITRAVKDGIIDPAKSIQIGIRTIAHQDYGIEIIDALEAHEMGSAGIAKRIYDRTGGTNVYLTFDIDCLDPAFAPGTGTPVCGGLSTAQALLILRHLKNLEIVGSDVVEVSPPFDHAGITAHAGATVAMYMLGLFWERRFKSAA